MEENLIVKANKLVEARYNLTLNQQKLFLCAVSKLERTYEKFEPVVINIKEFADLLDTEGKRYQEIRDIARSLRSKELFMQMDNKEISMGWFSKVKAEPRTGDIEIHFDEDLAPYLLQLKKHFTRYKLKNILQLSNKYSIRIYELLKEREGLGQRVFEVEELRSLLMIGDKYKAFKDFNKFVLKPTLQEINEYTDLDVELETLKRGRSVEKIMYKIESSDYRYVQYLDTVYDIEDIRKKSGFADESWTNKQVVQLYEISVEKTASEDVDIFEYMRLNYKKMQENTAVRKQYGYMFSALEKDYAGAVKKLKKGAPRELNL